MVQNFKLIFIVSFTIFDLECHVKPLLKLRLSYLALFSWNLENYRAFTKKAKNVISWLGIVTVVIHCMGLKLFSKYYSEFMTEMVRSECRKICSWL